MRNRYASMITSENVRSGNRTTLDSVRPARLRQARLSTQEKSLAHHDNPGRLRVLPNRRLPRVRAFLLHPHVRTHQHPTSQVAAPAHLRILEAQVFEAHQVSLERSL